MAAREIDEPLLPALLRPLVYMGAAFAFAFPLSTLHAAVATACGAGVGALLGRVLAGSRLRLWAIALGAGGLLGLAGLLRGALLSGGALASWLGPATALIVANAFAAGAGAACIAAALRTASLRQKLFRVFEVAFVGLAFAQLVASHRGGAINRPFELADSIIAQGGDPTLALLLVGAAAAAASVILLLSERSPLRSFMHLLLAFALLLVVLVTTRVMGLPQAKIGGSGLGLRPDEQEGKPQRNDGRGGGRRSDRNDNEQLEFQDNYETSGRQIPLAVVLLHDDYSPPAGLYYFRQAAFSQYNGRRLVQATRGDVDGDIAPSFVFEPTELADVPNEYGDRTELDTTVALLAEHNRPFALESPLRVKPEQNPDPGRFRRAYRVTSSALDAQYESLLDRKTGDPKWSAEQLAHYTASPPDPRYAELARKIVSGMPDWVRDNKVAQGVMISLWLSKEGTYSLKSGHAAAEDPTADFLFGDRTGYCVHFAHAAVYLMRSLGIPARVGAGYAVEEAARQGGSAILLSGANSHAWPEMYVRGSGWVVVDVAPERSLDPPVQPPDADLQRLLGEMARGQKPLPQSEWRPLEPALELARKLPAALARVLAVLVPLLLGLGYGVKLWRRLSPLWAGAGAAPRVAYRAQLDRLSELAITRRFGESRETFAARVAAHSPSFAGLTSRHVAACFGPLGVRAAERPRELERAVQRELASSAPWYRRLLGVLHPYSWLASR
jgi:transglutaminase-like putative cysteine protease